MPLSLRQKEKLYQGKGFACAESFFDFCKEK